MGKHKHKSNSTSRGVMLFLVLIIVMLIYIPSCISVQYDYDATYLKYWELADKSSSIKEKAIYIDKFVKVLERDRFEFDNYGRVFFKTDNYSFDYNLKALKSLRDRLLEIQLMDVQSFAYQQAIQQITSQEQGEAKDMLDVFQESYYLMNGFIFQRQILFIYLMSWIILILFSFYLINRKSF